MALRLLTKCRRSYRGGELKPKRSINSLLVTPLFQLGIGKPLSRTLLFCLLQGVLDQIFRWSNNHSLEQAFKIRDIRGDMIQFLNSGFATNQVNTNISDDVGLSYGELTIS
ncbi:hypothetical protein A0O30_23545 [Pseudomonas sp. LLC-1]|nr:hypothetical protein A0O30_23545 [Pseudomonas sp. LLC-1]